MTYAGTPIIAYSYVDVDGVTRSGTLTDYTLNSVTATFGRASITEQPYPSYANFALVADRDVVLPIDVGHTIEIKVTDGSTFPLFTGTVSDVQIAVAAYGSEGGWVEYAVTAVGPLATLQRLTSGEQGFAVEKDGTRISNILSNAYLPTWADMGGTTRWIDLPTFATWNTYGLQPTSYIDTPGQYEMAAYADGETESLTLAQEVAGSARGILWEDNLGRIHYTDYQGRDGLTPVALTAGEVLASDLSSTAALATVQNDITVSYTGSTPGSITVTDPVSSGRFSVRSAVRATSLNLSGDAQAQATAYLLSRSFPRYAPDRITIPFDVVSAGNKASLYGVGCETRISMTDVLPLAFGTAGDFDGFVEGWTWQLTRQQLFLTLNLSAYSETYPTTVWFQTTSWDTWSAYGTANPTKKWIDLL